MRGRRSKCRRASSVPAQPEKAELGLGFERSEKKRDRRGKENLQKPPLLGFLDKGLALQHRGSRRRRRGGGFLVKLLKLS